jgi:hypothetical protein
MFCNVHRNIACLCIGAMIGVISISIIGTRKRVLSAMQENSEPREIRNMSATTSHDLALLLDSPDDVEHDVSAILDQRGRLIERLLEVIDEANKGEYEYQQRAGAAVLLGQMRAHEAVNSLVWMLQEEVELEAAKIARGEAEFILDMNWFQSPVLSAFSNIGRPILPAMVEVIKTSDNEELRNRATHLMGHAIGKKSWTLEALESLLEQEQDSTKADRIRAAHGYLESHWREKTVEPY